MAICAHTFTWPQKKPPLSPRLVKDAKDDPNTVPKKRSYDSIEETGITSIDAAPLSFSLLAQAPCSRKHARLCEFDLDPRFGPCVGLTRSERWLRAQRLGLAPPSDVKSLLDGAPALEESLFTMPSEPMCADGDAAPTTLDLSVSPFAKAGDRVGMTESPPSATVQDAVHDLCAFDMNLTFGPCLGLTRSERWLRAQQLGLAPPLDVKSLLEAGDPTLQESMWFSCE